MDLSRIYSIMRNIVSKPGSIEVNALYTRLRDGNTSDLESAINIEINAESNPTIINLNNNESMLDKCTTIYETNYWLRDRSGRYRKFYVAICNDTGLIYGILESGLRNNGSSGGHYTMAERVVCRVADTQSALKMIKKLAYEADHKKTLRREATIIDDMLVMSTDCNLIHKLAKLQLMNVSDQQKYKEEMSFDNYNLYKDFIAFFSGRLEPEDSLNDYGSYDEYSDSDSDDDYYDESELDSNSARVSAAASIYERLRNAGMV